MARLKSASKASTRSSKTRATTKKSTKTATKTRKAATKKKTIKTAGKKQAAEQKSKSASTPQKQKKSTVSKKSTTKTAAKSRTKSKTKPTTSTKKSSTSKSAPKKSGSGAKLTSKSTTTKTTGTKSKTVGKTSKTSSASRKKSLSVNTKTSAKKSSSKKSGKTAVKSADKRTAKKTVTDKKPAAKKTKKLSDKIVKKVATESSKGKKPKKSLISRSKSGKKSQTVVEYPFLEDSKDKEKNNMTTDSTSLNQNNSEKNTKSNSNNDLASQITVEATTDAPPKRKRGRPRKSESTGSSPKLKETKGVKRFGVTFGRPGVAAGRYSWSAETGSSLVNEQDGNNDSSDNDFPDQTLSTNSIDVEYKKGDKVVYPALGLGIIEAIQVRTVGGTEQKFYMITIIETELKVMVPVGQAQTVGLRQVVDPTTVDKVYDILRDKDIVIDNQTWNRRYREYDQKIKTGSVLEIASVIRDLTVLKIEKELSFNEKKMLEKAQGRLVKELSIAKSSSEDSIKEELELICQP